VEEEGLFLCFRVGEERYLLDVATVKEVSRVQRLTAVPRAPAGIAGVIDLRGTFIPVVDVRLRLGGGETSVDPRRSRIVVVAWRPRGQTARDALHPVVRFRCRRSSSAGPGASGWRGMHRGQRSRGQAFLVIDAARSPHQERSQGGAGRRVVHRERAGGQGGGKVISEGRHEAPGSTSSRGCGCRRWPCRSWPRRRGLFR
jgi:hypothetical protein